MSLKSGKKGAAIRIILLFALLILFSISVYSETYYMANASCSDTGQGNYTESWCTFSYAFSHMDGGDSLILKDGIYSGDAVVIESGSYPPNGNESNYTLVAAENMWGAVLDGEASRTLIAINGGGMDPQPSYLHFDGLLLRNSSGQLAGFANINHTKITRCGFYETDNADGVYADPLFFRYADNVLIEDTAIWGNGRYHYFVLDSNHFVLRRCIDRYDRGVAVGYSNMGSFRIYSSSNVVLENCITIDGDQEQFYLQHSDTGLVSAVPKSYWPAGANGPTDNVHILGSMALNNRRMSMYILSAQWDPHNNSVENSVFWDGYNGLWSRVETQESMIFDHLTVGRIETGTEYTGIRGEYGYSVVAKNNIIYGSGTLSNDYALTWTDNSNNSSDYNVLYNNTHNYQTQHGAHPKANDISSENGNEVDPVTGTPGNGVVALKYLLKIEDGSDLDGTADDGGDRGATVLMKIGVTGTMWGEEGYMELTEESLWPWPYEDIIKDKMQQYYYTNTSHSVNGSRGFAAEGTGLYGGNITLTSYIWEYLGNPCPAEICNYSISDSFLDADLNTDNIINTTEVRYYISEWIEGSAQLGDLTNAIEIWKKGGSY